MIVGAAVVPSAPLLVPGVGAALAGDVATVSDAVHTVLSRLPDADVAVVLAAGGQGGDADTDGVYESSAATLRGIGRPDITTMLDCDRDLLGAIARASGYPLRRTPLPLGLTVLALHAAIRVVVPVAVPTMHSFGALAAVGVEIQHALASVRAIVVAAGDLSAGLTGRSPLHLVDGARSWDDQAVAAVDAGRLDGLRRIGPSEARRVGALGWAPLCVLAGVVAAAKLGMVVRAYAAPRGVGYLVAGGG